MGGGFRSRGVSYPAMAAVQGRDGEVQGRVSESIYSRRILERVDMRNI